jgi:hypothetical protein
MLASVWKDFHEFLRHEQCEAIWTLVGNATPYILTDSVGDVWEWIRSILTFGIVKH